MTGNTSETVHIVLCGYMIESVLLCPIVGETGFLCQKYKWEIYQKRINVTVLVQLDGKAKAFTECYTIFIKENNI